MRRGHAGVPAYLGRVLGDDSQPLGTCFQITPGVLATAWHVLDDAGASGIGDEVRVDDWAGNEATARVVRMDRGRDLAVLVSEIRLPGTVTAMRASDAVPKRTQVDITGVASLHDEHSYSYLHTSGDWQGDTVRDGTPLGRLNSTDVVRGMSGAPVRRSSDDTVIGVVSGRYNTADGWLPYSVWVARIEDLAPLLDGVTKVDITYPYRIRPSSLVAWSRTARTVATVLLLVLVTAFAVAPEQQPAACRPPVALTVAAAPDDLAAYRSVMLSYQQQTAQENGGCRTIDAYIYPASADQVQAGIDADWKATSHFTPAETGSRPDIWLPGSGVPPAVTPGNGHVLDDRIIAYSPLVLAVPQRLKGRIKSDTDFPDSWPTLFDQASAVGGVVRPDPNLSVEGLIATDKLYDGVTDPANVRQRFEQPIETATDLAGYPNGTLRAVLCRQRQLSTSTDGPAPASVIATEQAISQFNLDSSPLVDCAEKDPPAPAERLIAFYPAKTPRLGHHLVRLTWPVSAQSATARTAASAFQNWLLNEAGRDLLVALGYRIPFYHRSARALAEANGLIPDWDLNHPWEQPSTWPDPAVKSTYQKARRAARVLLALDTSGSMGKLAGRRTRFNVALAGVRSSVEQMGGRDQFGLWTFTTARPGGRERLRQLDRHDRARDNALLAQLATTIPAGDTPLYRTIDAAVKEVRRSAGTKDDQYLRAVVVLTDGQDTASGNVVPNVGGSPPVRIFIVAIGEASCADQRNGRTLGGLAEATGGECVEPAANTVDKTLNRLLSQLWSGDVG